MSSAAVETPASGHSPAHAVVSFALFYVVRLARQCPDCDVQYWTCTWDCYEQWGYQPICAELISYKTGNAEETTVFVNQCMAGCYVKAYEEFYAVQGFEPTFEQSGDPSCDDAWKRQQALDYDAFSSPDAFKYSELLPPEDDLPQWLQSELNAVKTNPSPSDDLELPLKLEECSVCQPGRDISGKAVLLQADGALAPAGAEETPAAGTPTETPDVPLPSPPSPPEVGPVVPADAPEAVASPVAPEPAMSPVAPSVEVTPAPVEVVIPGGSTASAALPTALSTTAVSLSSIVMLAHMFA